MNILLINPPAVDGVKQVREGRCQQRAGAWTAIWPPISLATTASVLRDNGFKVKINDCIVEELNFEDIQRIIEDFKPGLVILNVATPSIVSDLGTARYIKKVCRDVKIATIGIHCSALPKECLNFEQDIDFIVRGEPEYTVRDLAFLISNKNEIFLREVKGISYWDGGIVINNEDREVIENLDELSFPAWDLIDRGKYILPFSLRKFLLIATSRGCPHSCIFCAENTYYSRKYRKRSPERIADELEWVKNTFGIYDFLFWSESFTLDQNFARLVAEEIINRKIKVNWVCNSRVDNVDFNLLKIFKKAGCWMIGYGVESGSQKVLDLMGKKIKLSQIKEAVELSKKAGLKVTAHCILGFPGETMETMGETVNFVKKLDIDFVQFYCAVPFPGSHLYNLKDSGLYEFTFSDWKFFEQNFCVMNTKFLSAEQVMSFRRRAYKEFYLRPKIILNVLREIRSFKGLINFIGAIKEFMNWIE
ncbi:MAG: radical SAM protein [Candidatus Omnitrophota bacterium]|nr:radical SAM protein [Candidatus Omnitrophota bacterium]